MNQESLRYLLWRNIADSRICSLICSLTCLTLTNLFLNRICSLASTYKSKLEALVRHQKLAARIINLKDKFAHVQPLLHDMKARNIFQINLFHTFHFMFKCKEKIARPIFYSLFTPKPESKYNIRSRGKLTEPFHRKKTYLV